MAYLLLSLTALFWAGNFVLGRAMHLSIPPMLMAEIRWTLAFAMILPFLVPRLVANRAVIRQHWWKLVLMAVLSVASFNTLVYIGLTMTSATNATLLQSAVPIVILIITGTLLKEPVAMRQWLGVFISVLGVTTLITQGDLTQLLHLQINEGDIWILGAVLSWAIYSITLRWRPANLDGFTFFGVTVAVGVVVLLPFAAYDIAYSHSVVWSTDLYLTLIYMALCPSILAYLFWNRGVEELGAPKAGLFIHLMPIFGLLLSVLFLGEQVYSYHFIGMILIFSGIYLAVISDVMKRIRKSN